MKINNTAILAIGLAMTLAAENLPPAWREFLDPPREYAAFKRSARRVVVHERPDYTVEVYEQANGPKTTQRVFVAVPKGVRGRMPAVVAPFYFPEAMLGEDPATGGVECPYARRSGTNLTFYAAIKYMADLARRGYVTASADAYYITYPDGEGDGSFSCWKRAGEALARDWPGWTGVGKLAFDTRLVVDLLANHPSVDAGRIGMIGHSLGGKMAFYAGMLDPRVKVVVASDFGINWDQTNWQDVWYWGAKAAVAREGGLGHADLMSASGGKPFLLIAGKYDNAESWKTMLSARGYEKHPARRRIINHATGHRPPGWATAEGYRFLDAFLKFDSGVANRAVQGRVSVVGIPWSFPSNRIDWLFNPTNAKGPFNPEWTWQLNRMSFWPELARAYTVTGDEKYARAFARQFEDWLSQTGGVPPEKGYNTVGSPWRTIEEGLRLMNSWPAAWRAFSASPSFPTHLRERFVESMRAQAKHLMAHKTRANWLLMEMNGVHSFATLFPDFPESSSLRRDSARAFAEAARAQLLPDGLHYELSPDYHLVFYGCAAQLYRRARESGTLGDLPADFAELLVRGAEGPLAMMTPAFVQPRFNDCYTIASERVLASAAEFFPQRKDFLWGATDGRMGVPPAGATASRFLPWAGFAVMRSGWNTDAAYLAFDVGPLGVGHWHQDKLSFTLWKGGEELVFDDGGGQYERSPERVYALSGYDHNTLLVDGLAQNRSNPRQSDKPINAKWISTPERDFARGVYGQGFGPEKKHLALHDRQIEFLKPDRFLVTDCVKSADGKAHDYELLFHLDTTNTVVSADGRTLRARYGRKWDLEIVVEKGGVMSAVCGQRVPRLSGWFIGRDNLRNHPATTVSVRAGERCTNHLFRTRFVPLRADGK